MSIGYTTTVSTFITIELFVHTFSTITNFIILSIISSTSGSAVSVVQTGCFVGLGGVSVVLTASLIGNIVLVVTIGCILMRPLDQNK